MNVPAQGGTRGSLKALLVLLLFLLAAGVYANSFPGAFFSDDVTIVRENPLVADPDVGKILTSDYWGHGVNSGLYRPLTILSFALGRHALGPDARGVHLVNVLLHAAVTGALFLALNSVGIQRGVSFLAAALFAVHPIHAEVVNMAVGRAELLAALFVLLALRSASSARRGHEAVTVVLFASALLSKESAVTFPALLLAADIFPSTRTRIPASRRWRLYALLSVVVAGWLVARHRVALSTGVPPDAVYPLDNPLVGMPLFVRLLTVLKTQALYLGRLLIPAGQSPVYSGRALAPVESAASWGAAAGLGAAALLALTAIAGWRKRKGYGLGVLFYLAAFSVTSNLFLLIAVLMADRFSYLPSAGFALAASSLALTAASALPPRAGRAAVALCAAWVVALGAATFERNTLFRDPVTLWRSAALRDPGNARAWYFLAVARREAGMRREAEESLRRAIAAEPSFPDPRVALGDLLLAEGRLDEAVSEYREGLANAPGAILGAYLGLARASVLLGRPEEALAWLEKTEPVYRAYGVYWETKGRSLEDLGRAAEAAEAYATALDGKEFGRDIPSRLGRILLGLGRYPEAEEAFHHDLLVNGGAGALNNLGVAVSLQGRHAEAVELFSRALEMEPASELYRANLERSRRELEEAR